MSVRSLLIALLYGLTLLLVLVVIAAAFYLFAVVLGDPAVAVALRWALGVLAALTAADFALLVIVLAVDRVMGEMSDRDAGQSGDGGVA